MRKRFFAHVEQEDPTARRGTRPAKHQLAASGTVSEVHRVIVGGGSR